MKKAKLYVGCALKNAPREFVDGVLAMREKLKADPRLEILEFLGPGLPQDVYRRDIHECVEASDLMVAICDLPSLGLGYEMATHVKHHKRPLLALAREGAVVSGLIEGIHGEGPFAFRRYRDISDVPHIVSSWLDENPSFL